MKPIHLFPLVAALLSTPACFIHVEGDGDWEDGKSMHVHSLGHGYGSGNIVSETREVATFDRLQVSGGSIHIVAKVGTPQSVSLQGDDDLLRYVVTRVEDGTLVIDLDSEYVPARDVEFQIATETLRSLDLSGSARVEIAGLSGENFELMLSGSGEVVAQGSTDMVTAQVSGSGNLELGNLHVREARLIISGSGNATVDASEKLAVNISGSGSVSYHGSPLIEQQISGSGRVSSR